jgi:hypothetical protein
MSSVIHLPTVSAWLEFRKTGRGAIAKTRKDSSWHHGFVQNPAVKDRQKNRIAKDIALCQ